MAESDAYALRGFKGGAAAARIPGGLNAGVTGVIACDDLSSWSAATSAGPIRVMVNRTGATPEEIEVSSVSGNNITIAARGLEGTTDTDHGANATIELVSSPRDYREANRLVSKILGALAGNASKFLRVNAGETDIEWTSDPLLKTGGTMTGALTLSGAPSSDLHAATKAYVDTAAVSKRVRVATTANGTLATAFENGDTVDGVVLATGDRILLKNQTSGAENGIYVVAASGAPARAGDLDSSAKALPNLLVEVAEGTTNADTVWQLTTNATITLGTTALVFAQFGASSGTSGAATLVRKTADETVTSSTALQDDDHLFFAIGASEVWAVDFALSVVALSATPDLKMQVVGPAGATVVWGASGLAVASTSEVGSANMPSPGASTASVGVNATTRQLVMIRALIVNSTTAGNVKLQWAQDVSDANFTKIAAGSYLIANKF